MISFFVTKDSGLSKFKIFSLFLGGILKFDKSKSKFSFLLLQLDKNVPIKMVAMIFK